MIGCVDGDTVHKPKEMVHLGILWILNIVFNGLTFFNGGVQTCGKVCMISFLKP